MMARLGLTWFALGLLVLGTALALNCCHDWEALPATSLREVAR